MPVAFEGGAWRFTARTTRSSPSSNSWARAPTRSTCPGPTDVYVELQAYDVGAFGHEILLNGDPLTGFDVPPAEGWQYWMDAVTEQELRTGENTLRIRRDTDTDDAFAVGNVVVNWREPAE